MEEFEYFLLVIILLLAIYIIVSWHKSCKNAAKEHCVASASDQEKLTLVPAAMATPARGPYNPSAADNRKKATSDGYKAPEDDFQLALDGAKSYVPTGSIDPNMPGDDIERTRLLEAGLGAQVFVGHQKFLKGALRNNTASVRGVLDSLNPPNGWRGLPRADFRKTAKWPGAQSVASEDDDLYPPGPDLRWAHAGNNYKTCGGPYHY